MLEHVKARKVAEEQLHRDQHCRQPEPPVQHDLCRRAIGSPAACSHAPAAAMLIAVVRNAANSMCGQRTIITGPSTMVRQSAGMILPSTITWPTGTCIHELLARIQNEESIVPSVTLTVVRAMTR